MLNLIKNFIFMKNCNNFYKIDKISNKVSNQVSYDLIKFWTKFQFQAKKL